MGLRNTAKKITKRTGRAFGVSDIIDEMNRMSIKLEELSSQIVQLQQEQQVRLEKQTEDLNLRLEQEVQYLAEVTQTTVDITKSPKAHGQTRLLQEGNLKLLLAVKKILDKYNLEFFLDYGSMLGAVRHGGYIPWDDDIDISMLREDYNKLLGLLNQEFTGTKLFYVHSEIIRIFYGNTPLQIDIFPIDFYERRVENPEDKLKISKKIFETQGKYIRYDYSKLFNRERVITSPTYKEIEQVRNREICREVSKAEGKKGKYAIYHGLEEIIPKTLQCLHNYEWIYPLQKVKFMGHLLPIPHRPDILLTQYYGDYMGWPRDLHPKHDDIEGRITLESLQIVRGVADGKIDLLAKSS